MSSDCFEKLTTYSFPETFENGEHARKGIHSRRFQRAQDRTLPDAPGRSIRGLIGGGIASGPEGKAAPVSEATEGVLKDASKRPGSRRKRR